jgi:Citrate synthase
MTESIKVPKGLERVIVDQTSISSTDSKGHLIYRGYSATDLAAHASFEQTAYLLINGKLPSSAQLTEFSKRLKEMSNLTTQQEALAEFIGTTYPDNPIIDNLRTVISGIKLESKDESSQLLEMAAKIPGIISKLYYGSAQSPAKGGAQSGYAATFYRMITGKSDISLSKHFEKLLILYMEHEFNASTFALRVTASTLAGPKPSFTSALATLKGPLHGGANSEILNYLLSVKSRDEAIKYVDSKLAKKEKIMGFGHRVYKDKDPRAEFVKGQIREVAKRNGMEKLLEFAEAIEERMWESKRIPANAGFLRRNLPVHARNKGTILPANICSGPQLRMERTLQRTGCRQQADKTRLRVYRPQKPEIRT